MTPIPAALHLLDLPSMPAVLERALGYGRAARYVLFYWEQGIDEAIWCDGQMTTDGDWQSFLCFIEHPAIRWAVTAYAFGASDAPACDGLVLDRETRRVYAGPIDVARQYVQAQHGPRQTIAEWAEQQGITVAETEAHQQEIVTAWFADFQAEFTAQRGDARAVAADVAERMRINAANLVLLQAALDALPLPSPHLTPQLLTLHRITCGVCGSLVGTLPQPKDAVSARIEAHLRTHQHLTAPGSTRVWETRVAGGKHWVQDGHPILIIEPPHVWLRDGEIAGTTLATHFMKTMADLCRENYAGLFDELALGIWSDVTKSALLQRVMQVTSSRSLILSMIEHTIDYLAALHQQWLGGDHAPAE